MGTKRDFFNIKENSYIEKRIGKRHFRTSGYFLEAFYAMWRGFFKKIQVLIVQ